MPASGASREDIFLLLDGVKGESQDAIHEDEIEVVSWSWSIQAKSGEMSAMRSSPQLHELVIVKNVDKSSPVLRQLLVHAKGPIKTGKLTVRKAGQEALEYLKLEMESIRVTGVTVHTDGAEHRETVTLSFPKIKMTYLPQGATGAQGGGATQFEYDARQAPARP